METYTKSGEEIYVDNKNIVEKYDISDFVEKIEFIELKDGKESTIGDIFKLFYEDGKFIVLRY